MKRLPTRATLLFGAAALFVPGCASTPQDVAERDALIPVDVPADTAAMDTLHAMLDRPLVVINGRVYVPGPRCIDPRFLGGDAEGRAVGGDAEGRNVGGDAEGRNVGGDAEGRNVGGDAEGRNVGGDAEGRNVGGDAEGRNVGGDAEGRNVGGDAEGRNVGGDAEGRNVGGDAEGRSIGGDAEGRNVGAGQYRFACEAAPVYPGFKVVTDRLMEIQIYEGELRALSPAAILVER